MNDHDERDTRGAPGAPLRRTDAPAGDTAPAGPGDLARVISGRLGTWGEAERLSSGLIEVGFKPAEIDVFYTGPAGRHARTPIGGDSHADAGSTHAGSGATLGGLGGAAVGLAVGAAVASAPVAGPVVFTAAAVGAFGGALAGGVGATEDATAEGAALPDTEDHPVAKPGGIVVAVRTDRLADGERLAVDHLCRIGAIAIERATARWHDGAWADWDPSEPREQIAPAPGTPQA